MSNFAKFCILITVFFYNIKVFADEQRYSSTQRYPQKGYLGYKNQQSIYSSNSRVESKPFDQNNRNNTPIKSKNIPLPQQNIVELQQNKIQLQNPIKNTEGDFYKQKIAQREKNDDSNGIVFNIYASISASSGKYRAELPKGWNVISVTPSTTSISQTSSGSLYQNFTTGQTVDAKISSTILSAFAKLKLPALLSANEIQFIRPFAIIDLQYSTEKSLEIEAQKEVSYTTTAFNNVKSKYKYNSLKYGIMIGGGIYLYKGLYGLYGYDIYNTKKRFETGYDFGPIMIFLAYDSLTYQDSSDPNSLTTFNPKINYTAFLGGARLRLF
jgi:hypothetical protein